MTSSMNPGRPCPTCNGKGVIVVTPTKDGKKQEPEQHPCPTCRGSKKSNGIATK